MQNLPYPTPSIIDNHGYVSLIDCVAHLLSLNDNFTKSSLSTDNVPSMISNITESTAVAAIRKRASVRSRTHDVISMFCTEWSDDFDPSVSIKANRKSCWIKTVTTMSCNSNDTIDKMGTTFPKALRKKGHSHEAVELKFAEELCILQSGNCSMYSKAYGYVVPIYLELLVSLQDQPERRGMNHLC
jgi:hypothetical protein